MKRQAFWYTAGKGAAQKPAGWNAMLAAGVILCGLVFLVAVAGPWIAPHDPLQENYVAEVGGRFIRPPFPPGVDAFPLGTDEFGRDVLSRLLWAVRPTLTMVLVVAALRITIGIGAGLLAGWSTKRAARLLDGAIAAALSAPVLFVALCVVAALARRWGVWAFVLGLSITGWAETARLVQEQTRAVKTQPYIEAVHGLGGSGGQIVFTHVLPQILPLLWIQLAFEAGAAMMAAAALGFLGYYVNAVWIPIEDWVGLRVSGLPELSQMIGASVIRQPWTAVYAGLVMFLILLAFNLLGEGLRRHLSPERRRSAIAGEVPASAATWVEERLFFAVSEWRRSAATGGAFLALAAVALGGGWFLWRAQAAGLTDTHIVVPGEHAWASELRDAQGTLWASAPGPNTAELAWVYTAPEEFAGGPVVDAAGRLYINGAAGNLYRLDAAGVLSGIFAVPAPPLGAPALRSDGVVIVADMAAGLSAFRPDGTLLWHYASDPPDEGRASPIVGPDDTVYLVIKNFIVAVDASGQRRWQIRLPTYSFVSPVPRLSPAGDRLLFEDTIVDAATGQRLFHQTGEPMDTYLAGADGKLYMHAQNKVMVWQETATGAVMTPHLALDANMLLSSMRSPALVGVSPSGQGWLLYASGFEYQRLVWAPPNNQAVQITDLPYRTGRLAGIDRIGTAYVCGFPGTHGDLECRAVQLSSGMVLWKRPMETRAALAGAALADGRLYVATVDGKVFAIGPGAFQTGR